MNRDTNKERIRPDREFQEKCLQEREIKVSPAVKILEQEVERQALAKQHQNNSDYFLEGAQNLLKSSTPSLSILVGFFALEHKANQLLALKGYKVESHVCTQMALSRIVGRPDLARKISFVFESRQNIGYRVFLKQDEEERKNAEKIINEEVIPFLEEINRLIGKE